MTQIRYTGRKWDRPSASHSRRETDQSARWDRRDDYYRLHNPEAIQPMHDNAPPTWANIIMCASIGIAMALPLYMLARVIFG